MTGFPKEDIDVMSSMADEPDQGNADTGTRAAGSIAKGSPDPCR